MDEKQEIYASREIKVNGLRLMLRSLIESLFFWEKAGLCIDSWFVCNS